MVVKTSIIEDMSDISLPKSQYNRAVNAEWLWKNMCIVDIVDLID